MATTKTNTKKATTMSTEEKAAAKAAEKAAKEAAKAAEKAEKDAKKAAAKEAELAAKNGHSTMGGHLMIPKNPHFLDDSEFMMNKMKVRIYFIQDVLGTWANNKQLVTDFISNSAVKKIVRTDTSLTAAEEPDFCPEIEDPELQELKAMTVFPRNPRTGEPVMMGYQVKGFFKAAAKACRNRADSKSAKMTAFVSKIDSDINIVAKYAQIHWGPDNRFHNLQRPLRAETAKGPRVALANSEVISAGAYFDMEISFPVDKYVDLIQEWLNYGYYVGLLQWRNAGYGRFMYQILDDNDQPVAGNMSPAKLAAYQQEWEDDFKFALENEARELAMGEESLNVKNVKAGTGAEASSNRTITRG